MGHISTLEARHWAVEYEPTFHWFGYMLLRSSYAPKTLAVLVMIAAAGEYLGEVVTSTLSPSTGASLSPVFIVMTVIGEGSLVLWLLIKGLNFTSRVPEPSKRPRWLLRIGHDPMRKVNGSLG